MINNDNTATKILPSAFFALLVTTFSGTDFLSLPHYAAKICGPSGYWAILIAGVFALLFIGLTILIKGRFPNQNIIEIAPMVLTKPLAIVGNVLFLAIFLIWLILGVRDASDLVLTYLLVRTPLWVVEIFFLLCIGYIATNGLVAVMRMASFVVLPTLLFRLLMTVFGFQDIAVSQLLPLFSAQPLAYLQGGLILTHAFVPLATVLLIYPQITKGKKLIPVVLGATGGALFLFLITVIGTIGVFGAPLTERFTWSNLVVIHRISFPFLVLEQLGLLFLIVWLTVFLIAGACYVSLIAGGLKQQFAAFNYRWTVLISLVLIGSCGLLLPNAATVNWAFDLVRQWIGLPVLAYPLLIYFVAIIRGLRKSAEGISNP